MDSITENKGTDSISSIEESCGGPYTVDRIIGIYVGEKNNKRYYRVKWTDSWEPEENLSEACQRLIDDFWKEKTIDPIFGKVVTKSDLKAGQQVIIKQEIEEINLKEESKLQNIGNPPVQSSSVHTARKSTETVTIKHTDFQFFNTNEQIIKDNSKMTGDFSKKDSLNTVFKEESRIQNDKTNVKETLSKTAVEILPISPRQANLKSKLNPDEIDSVCLKVSMKSYRMVQTPENTIETKIPNYDPSEVCYEKAQNSVKLDDLENTNTEMNRVGYLSQRSVCDNISEICDSSDTEGSINEPSKSNSLLPIPINVDCDANVINLEEIDDDLEIIGTVTTPKRKRGRPSSSHIFHNNSTPSAMKNSEPLPYNYTPSQVHNTSFTRLCQTNPVSHTSPVSHVKKPRSYSEERNRNKLTPNSMLLHPRRLLQYSSQGSDSDDLSLSSDTFQIHRANDEIQSPSHSPLLKKKQNRFSEISSQPPQAKSSLLNSRSLKTRQQQRRRNDVLIKEVSNKEMNNDNFNNLSKTDVLSISGAPQTLTSRTCNLCDCTFTNLTLARQHVNHVHAQNSTLNSSMCTICCGIFKSPRDLKSHMLLHGDTEKLHKCDVCLRTFKHRSVLNQHLLIHSGELPYECDSCQKRFRQQGHLIVHMAQHEDDSNLMCPRCIIEFPNFSLYAKHMSKHSSELAYYCQLCEEGFQLKSDLLLHLQAHVDEKPFFCHVCKKSFKTKAYLFGHIQMHKSRLSSDIDHTS